MQRHSRRDYTANPDANAIGRSPRRPRPAIGQNPTANHAKPWPSICPCPFHGGLLGAIDGADKFPLLTFYTISTKI